VIRRFLAFVTLAILLASAHPASAQTPKPAASAPTGAPASATAPAPTPEQAKLLKSTEAFVRDLFAWGPEFKVQLGPLSPSVSPDFYIVPLSVTFNNQTDTGVVYSSKDGKTLLRGEMYDTSASPFADNLAHMHLENNPSIGPSNAKVTVVEFSDFQCPHCLLLYKSLKTIEPKYPQIRVVYKDFPINQLHPWAETAAIGARCAYMQSPDAFWAVHDHIFDNQEVISTENVWEKLVAYATQAGLNAETFKACMTSPEAKQAVEANREDGVALSVTSTPSIFVNGRPLVGGSQATLEQYINYELSAPSQ